MYSSSKNIARKSTLAFGSPFSLSAMHSWYIVRCSHIIIFVCVASLYLTAFDNTSLIIPLKHYFISMSIISDILYSIFTSSISKYQITLFIIFKIYCIIIYFSCNLISSSKCRSVDFGILFFSPSSIVLLNFMSVLLFTLFFSKSEQTLYKIRFSTFFCIKNHWSNSSGSKSSESRHYFRKFLSKLPTLNDVFPEITGKQFRD